MSCHTVPDTMISLGTRFYSLAITLPRCTACVYCLEHTCQIKEQLMHLIFNYCLALQTTGKCQSERSCIGATKTDIFFGKEKNRNKICMEDSVVLQFTVTKMASQTLNNSPSCSTQRILPKQKKQVHQLTWLFVLDAPLHD